MVIKKRKFIVFPVPDSKEEDRSMGEEGQAGWVTTILQPQQ
jgi:hypothetical protein